MRSIAREEMENGRGLWDGNYTSTQKIAQKIEKAFFKFFRF